MFVGQWSEFHTVTLSEIRQRLFSFRLTFSRLLTKLVGGGGGDKGVFYMCTPSYIENENVNKSRDDVINSRTFGTLFGTRGYIRLRTLRHTETSKWDCQYVFTAIYIHIYVYIYEWTNFLCTRKFLRCRYVLVKSCRNSACRYRQNGTNFRISAETKS